jgi:low affinity Fe/Cu permease
MDELIRATEARNKLAGIEKLSEREIESVRKEMNSEKGSHIGEGGTMGVSKTT